MSAWWGHVPFAHWLVTAIQPNLIVELGTHNGVSFAAFCEGLQRVNQAGRCYAVDTWRGDEHAGMYGEEVYDGLASFVSCRYPAFAELIRTEFDRALPQFADGSIDLLHIDGLHTYEAVKHDFESWLPKLSKAGVVLLHDTNVRQGDFGVWKLWDELQQRYPCFEFLHGHGLGLVAVGAEIPDPLPELFGLRCDAKTALRERFAHLGARWIASDLTARAGERIQGLLTTGDHQTRSLHEHASEIVKLRSELENVSGRLLEQAQRIANLEAEREHLVRKGAEQAHSIAGLEIERQGLTQSAAEQAQRIANLEATREHLSQQVADQAQHINTLEADRERLVLNGAESTLYIASLEAERERLSQKVLEQVEHMATMEGARDQLSRSAADHARHIAGFRGEREAWGLFGGARRR